MCAVFACWHHNCSEVFFFYLLQAGIIQKPGLVQNCYYWKDLVSCFLSYRAESLHLFCFYEHFPMRNKGLTSSAKRLTTSRGMRAIQLLLYPLAEDGLLWLCQWYLFSAGGKQQSGCSPTLWETFAACRGNWNSLQPARSWKEHSALMFWDLTKSNCALPCIVDFLMYSRYLKSRVCGMRFLTDRSDVSTRH